MLRHHALFFWAAVRGERTEGDIRIIDRRRTSLLREPNLGIPRPSHGVADIPVCAKSKETYCSKPKPLKSIFSSRALMTCISKA